MTRGIDVRGVISPREWARVERLLTERTRSPRLRERLEMVKAAYQDDDLRAIVRWSGRTDETVRRWLRAFGEGGVDALVDAPRAGRPCRADAAYLSALVTAAESAPPSVGLPFDVWTSARLSAYLAEPTGTRIAPGWLRVLLTRQHFACGRSKHSGHHLQDSIELAACRTALQAVGEKGGRRSGTRRVAL
jgi:transposase